jgi:hypothetical protein
MADSAPFQPTLPAEPSSLPSLEHNSSSATVSVFDIATEAISKTLTIGSLAISGTLNVASVGAAMLCFYLSSTSVKEVGWRLSGARTP